MIEQTPNFLGIGQRILDTAPTYHRVEIIKKRLLEIDFEPVQNVERLRYAMETAINANLHEGNVRTDEMIALDEMLFQAKVPPGELTIQLKKDWFSLYMSETGA